MPGGGPTARDTCIGLSTRIQARRNRAARRQVDSRAWLDPLATAFSPTRLRASGFRSRCPTNIETRRWQRRPCEDWCSGSTRKGRVNGIILAIVIRVEVRQRRHARVGRGVPDIVPVRMAHVLLISGSLREGSNEQCSDPYRAAGGAGRYGDDDLVIVPSSATESRVSGTRVHAGSVHVYTPVRRYRRARSRGPCAASREHRCLRSGRPARIR